MKNCANILAFIQIAVAFDLGLVWLNDSHILKGLHSSFLKELKVKHKKILERANGLINTGTEHRSFQTRLAKANIASSFNELDSKLNPENANWGKYAYLGLFGGIYGLICLLAIGMFEMFDNSFDRVLRSFILFAAQLILFIEVLSVFQIFHVEKRKVSITKMFKKVGALMILLAVAYFCAVGNWGWKKFDCFEIPFMWFTVAIVYMPVFVYAGMVAFRWWEINKLAKECDNACKAYNRENQGN